MKQLLLAATILAGASSPGWAVTAFHVTDSLATGSDPVLLNEATNFTIDLVGNPDVDSPLTVYFVEPTGAAAPAITSALFNGATPDAFSVGAAQTWNAATTNSLYAFEGCKGCDASVNRSNIDAVLGTTESVFTVIPVSISQAFAKGDFESVLGAFSVGTVIAPFGTNASGKVFDTSWTNAGFVDARIGSIPEPSTWAMMLAGFGLLSFTALRKRRKEPRLAV